MLNAIGIYVGKNVLSGGPAPVPVPVATAATGISDTSFVANWDVYSGAKYYLLDVSLSSSFSTFILQNQPVYTNTFTVTGLVPNTTYYYRVRANTDYDTDAQAFFTRVTTAGGTLTVSEQIAINSLVLDMKYAGVWTKMKAVYPMVGSSAAACAQNLISSSYTGSFTSGWTFASTGATPNGAGAYMNTTLVPSTELTLYSVGLSVYSRTNTGGTVQKAEIACAVGGSYLPLIQLAVRRYENASNDQYVNQLYSYNGGEGRVYITNTDSRGFYTTSRTSSSLNKSYKNGVVVGTSTDVISQTQPSVPLYISALNANNTGVQDYSDRELAFASIGDGLTDTDASRLYTTVQTFQTRLSRQVGTPAVSDPDAQAFISRVYAAGGTLSGSEPISINDLTTDLKINNLWSKMKAVYPMVGASAAACAQNLRNASFTGTFSSGWTYASTGVTPNGTSAYMETNMNQSANLSNNSVHLSYYSRTSSTPGSFDIGGNNGAPNFQGAQLAAYYGGIGAIGHLHSYPTDSVVSTATTDTRAFYLASRTSSTSNKIFRNSTLLNTSTTSRTSTLANVSFRLATDYSGFTNRECAFASIGDGLSDTEATNLYTIVQTFQTRLSRQVGTPVVSDSDAQAFINRVYTAGGTLSGAEPIAVNQFTIDLKAANLWTKMQAIYPMVGASAAACAQNLKSSSYTASFTAGWTFASTGVTGNAASSYMDTGFVPSTEFASFNNGASLYSRTNSTAAMYDYGVQASGGIGHNVYLNYPSFGARWHLQCVFADRPIYTPSGTESAGFFIGVTGAANDRRVYRNASLRANNTAISTTNLTTLTQSIPLGCLRDTGTGYQAYSNREYSLFALHQSLTVAEVTSFTSINLTFQTRLSRNV